MKTGHISNIITIVFIMSALVLTSCSNSLEEVKLEIHEKKAIDFDKYDKIVYADLALENTPEGFSPVNELNEFFVNDLTKLLEKKVEHLNVTDIDKDIKIGAGETARLEKIKERLKDSPNSLLITGNLIFDIKTRSKIEDVKDETGKKGKGFVKVQHWGLTMKIEVIEVLTGQVLFNKNYSEKTSSADIVNPKYNFDDLFFKMNNNFTRDFINKKSTQRRYLLTN